MLRHGIRAAKQVDYVCQKYTLNLRCIVRRQVTLPMCRRTVYNDDIVDLRTVDTVVHLVSFVSYALSHYLAS